MVAKLLYLGEPTHNPKNKPIEERPTNFYTSLNMANQLHNNQPHGFNIMNIQNYEQGGQGFIDQVVSEIKEVEMELKYGVITSSPAERNRSIVEDFDDNIEK